MRVGVQSEDGEGKPRRRFGRCWLNLSADAPNDSFHVGLRLCLTVFVRCSTCPARQMAYGELVVFFEDLAVAACLAASPDAFTTVTRTVQSVSPARWPPCVARRFITKSTDR